MPERDAGGSPRRRPGRLPRLVFALLTVALLLAGGCGRKAKPEPLFGGGTTHHYETR